MATAGTLRRPLLPGGWNSILCDSSACVFGPRIAGTLRQYHNLQAAEAAALAEEANESETTTLLEIPRGKYKDLDTLDDVSRLPTDPNAQPSFLSA